MRRIALFAVILVACFFTSCGGKNYNGSSSSNPVSKIAKRAFVSNQATSAIEIVDAARDTLPINPSTQFPFTISAGSAPTLMVETVDKKDTIVYGSGANTVSVVDNTKEAVTNSVNLRNPTESFAISQDDRFLFVAERNTFASGATLAGAVEIFDLNNVSAGATVVSVPGARQLVLSHNGSVLLVFSDDPTLVGGVPNNSNVFFINTANAAAGATPVPGFDHPVFAVFTSDDSTAYVLNCGPECGGTTAGVAAVSVGTHATTATTSSPVPARTALLSGTTLYVAGTNSIGGQLTVLNAATLTPMVAGVAIPDGIHDRIALGSNGKLFIGARTCTITATQACLAIYDTTTNPGVAVIHPPFTNASGNLPADVTAIEPIPNRNVVYVCEGGELKIYNTTTSSLQTSPVIDIVGKAIDVKEVF
ncbi:MAG TPA: hypothetical protein VFA71_05665 [Terriglobales bacterium]|nr:hypothetical protein [Terriglobales bacterium]